MNEYDVRAIVLTALTQAKADGDDAAAARLAELLANPREAAKLLNQLAAA